MKYLTEDDKERIRDNQQELVNILGTEDLVKGYNTQISDYGDYELLAEIAPIFERLSNGCYDPVDEIDSVNQEIIEFLYMLPTISVEFELDTFRANLKSFDKLLAFKSNLFEVGLFERLLDSEELTKEEKEKLISIVFNETMKE